MRKTYITPHGYYFDLANSYSCIISEDDPTHECRSAPSQDSVIGLPPSGLQTNYSGSKLVQSAPQHPFHIAIANHKPGGPAGSFHGNGNNGLANHHGYGAPGGLDHKSGGMSDAPPPLPPPPPYVQHFPGTVRLPPGAPNMHFLPRQMMSQPRSPRMPTGMRPPTMAPLLNASSLAKVNPAGEASNSAINGGSVLMRPSAHLQDIIPMTTTTVTLVASGNISSTDTVTSYKNSMGYPPPVPMVAGGNGVAAAIMGTTPVTRPSSLGVQVPTHTPPGYSLVSSSCVDANPSVTPMPPPQGSTPPISVSRPSSVEISVAYTCYNPSSTTGTTAVVAAAYSSPGADNQSPGPPLSRDSVSAGMPQPAPSPVGTAPTPPTPRQMSPPASTPTATDCSMCGHCGQSRMPPSPAMACQFGGMWPGHGGGGGPMAGFPTAHPPHMHPMAPHHRPPTAHGLVSANVPYPPYSPLPNGLSPEVLFNNQANFVMQQHRPPPPLPIATNGAGILGQHPALGAAALGGHYPMHAPTPGLLMGHPLMHHHHQGTLWGSKGAKNLSPMCCNCGATGHRGPECKESTFDMMARSGDLATEKFCTPFLYINPVFAMPSSHFDPLSTCRHFC